MGVELLEIGVKARKGVIFTIRGCFKSVCNHPFLVGMLCFLIYLYRSSPFIFQLLVSASPIIVCTAVLLGTLLSFGQPNIPEIEIEETTTVEAVSIKTGVLGDATVVENNESHCVERFSDNRWDEEVKSTDQLASKHGEVLRREDSDDTALLIEERSREIEESDGENMGGERELSELRFKGKSEWIEERLNNGDVGEDHHHLHSSAGKVNGELLESDDEKSEADSFDSEKVNVDSLDSPPRSPWARVAEREDEEEEESEKERDEDEDEDEEGSESESDCAESSSPDASMVDIMPMLDELHPLLDEEGPQTVHLSHSSSDVASEKSLKSSASSHHNSEDDESENHEDLEEAAGDENEDGEDEEDARGDKDEETKSAITWTEEDQKNLMDLGTSEIERNQRLENLILRRRARKSTNLFAERNLIDLESSDLPFNIAPISTRRQNPFDLPQGHYDDDLGLPPIPGSAPSVLLQRRNPFDIPYDSSEEKPDLKGDVFQEEFTTQSREPVFRRHESFNVGPSIFAPRRQDVKMRPYFVPERTISEESSSSLFQRQSSGLSDSKVSSIPETESVTSVEDLEEKKLLEIDSLPEREVERTKEVAEEGPSGDPEVISRQEVDTEEDVHEELEMISKMESVSEHIGHGSQSSEDEVEKIDVQVEESQLEDVTDHYKQGSTSQYVEVHDFGHGSNFEAVESTYTRDSSSSSSLSEVSERVFIDTEGEGLSLVEGRRDDGAVEPIISTQTSLGSTDLNISSPLVVNFSQRAPVYDSSPRELSKNVSSSSISSDVLPDSDLGVPPALDELTTSSIGAESEGSHREIKTDVPLNIETLPDSSISHSVAAESRMEEHLMEKHMLDEVSVSIDDKNIHTEDQDLEQAEEKHLLLSEASETKFEGVSRTEHSSAVDETVQPPDSDADIQHDTDEKLISMLSSEGKTSLFYDNAIQEPDFNHFNEVQETSTSVESFLDGQITQDLNTPEVQELDRYINSPLSPKFISVLPSAIETNSSRFDVQTVVEEVDEIKEIDDGLLSELDSVGDFSIRQFESGTSEFEKHVDSVGEESLFSTHQPETSSARAVEVHSAEVNKIEQFLLSEESREHIDVYEQDIEHISEIQTYEMSRGENIKVSKSDEYDHDSPYQDHNHEDTEVRSVEDTGVVAEKAELASVEAEAMVRVAEVSCQNQVDKDTTSGMPELKAGSIEDIDLAFKQISSAEIEKHIVLDPPQAELQNHEETVSAIPESELLSIDDAIDAVPKKAESSYVETEIMVGIVNTDTTVEDIDLAFKQIGSEASEKLLVLEPVGADTPSLMHELEATKIEDIDHASKQSSSMEIEKHVVLEPPQAELHNYEDTDSGTPEQEVLLAEDAHAVPKHTDYVETAVVVAGADVSSQGLVHTETSSEITEIEASTVEALDLAYEKRVDLELVDTDSTPGMPEIEAGSIEAINQAFKHIDSNEIENRDVLELLQPELVIGETTTENSKDAAPHRDTRVPVSTNEASVLELGQSNDAIIDDKQTADIITGIDGVHDSVNITKNSEDGVVHRDRSVMVSTKDSVDHTLHVVESIEMQRASSELHVAEAVPTEGTTLLPNQVFDGETREQLKLKSDGETVEIKADGKIGASEEEFEAEKPNNEDEAVKDLHSPSSSKGKGKLSRSSSLSSSSSSDSSSSDSDASPRV